MFRAKRIAKMPLWRLHAQRERRTIIMGPAYKFAKSIMPKISATEQAALNSGTVGFDRDIFGGRPSLASLVSKYDVGFTEEEQSFFDNECNELCEMIDDYQVGIDQNLPAEVWRYCREKGFLGLCISKEYGGKGFSAHAHSVMLQKVATRSVAAAVTVMVPNSLGPAELLKEYGTDIQKNHYLPRLAAGVDIPCFALTGPPSGSDAASMRDTGVVFRDDDGALKIRATFNKRYITLAPVASVVGLAINLQDPDNLLKGKGGEGITVCLVDRGHPGLVTGPRHNPLDAGFMNGTVRGEDVVLSMDQVVGGQERCGFGWNMLMECLGEGRGISLPASAGGICQTAVNAVGGYARIRKQFKTPVAEMEGVQEKLARMASLTLTCTAAQHLFNAIVGNHEKPPVLSAIMKLKCTEMGRVVGNDAMDVIGGAGICKGPMNYMAAKYQSMPVAITVEGANILTRSLIVFGQGLNRAHPNMQDIVSAIGKGDAQDEFSKHAWSLVGHGAKNAGSAFSQALVRSRSNPGGKGAAAYHEAQLQRLAAAFAVTTDLGLVLGGKLKTAEFLSGRYADILSNLYLGYAVLWYAKKNPVEGMDTVVDHAMQNIMHDTEEAFKGISANFPIRPVGWLMRLLAFPTGYGAYPKPADSLTRATAQLITKETAIRDKLSESVFISKDPEDRINQINAALPVCLAADEVLRKLRREKRAPTPEEEKLVNEAEELREVIIQVDAFDAIAHPHEELVMGTEPKLPGGGGGGGGEGKKRLTRMESFDPSMLEARGTGIIREKSGTTGHNDPTGKTLDEEGRPALGW